MRGFLVFAVLAAAAALACGAPGGRAPGIDTTPGVQQTALPAGSRPPSNYGTGY